MANLLLEAKVNGSPRYTDRTADRSDRMVEKMENKTNRLKLKVGGASPMRGERLRKKINVEREKTAGKLNKMISKGKKIGEYADAWLKGQTEQKNIDNKYDILNKANESVEEIKKNMPNKPTGTPKIKMKKMVIIE